jgi:hypothetical protein
MTRPHNRGRYATLLAATGTIATLSTVVTLVLLTGGSPAAAAASPVTATVDTGATPLNVRASASTTATVLRTVPNGGTVMLACQVVGPSIQGTVRTTTMWDRTTAGGYVSDAYVRRATIGACPATPQNPSTVPVPAPTAGWVIPVPNTPGQRFRPASNPHHDGVDIMEPRNTRIQAANAGTVITVECNASQSCDVDGSSKVTGCGWYVEIRHANQVVTRYCHMVKHPSVTVGQRVFPGQIIGYVGTSGNSSGTHLHFEVHSGPGYASSANAIDPVEFMRRMGAPLGGAS